MTMYPNDKLPENLKKKMAGLLKSAFERQYKKPFWQITEDDVKNLKTGQIMDVVTFINEKLTPEEKNLVDVASIGEAFESLFNEAMKQLPPRDQAARITEGIDEPHHIGKMSPEMIAMEIFSLANTKPAFRDDKWQNRYDTLNQVIHSQLKSEPAQFGGLLRKLESVRSGEL